MQMLDQQIAAARAIAKQELNFMRSRRIDLTAFRRRLGPLPSRAGMFEGAYFLRVMDHRKRLVPALMLRTILASGMPDAKGNYGVPISI
jgi:hypothetical protein